MSPASDRRALLLQEVELLQMSKGRGRKLLSTISDCVGKFSEWRNQELCLLLRRTLKHTDHGAKGVLKHPRFSLTTFLLENRVPPIVVVEWYIERGMLRDRAARDHVRSIIEQWWAGQLARQRAYHMPWRITTTPPTMFERWEADTPISDRGGDTVDDCRCAVKCLTRCKFGDWDEHYFPICGPSKSVREYEHEQYAHALWLLSNSLKASLGRFIMTPEVQVKDVMLHEGGSDDDEPVLYCDQTDGHGLPKYTFPVHITPKHSTPITVGKRPA